MSHPAEKGADDSHPSDPKEERTGRFAIDEARRGTVLPPAGDDADLISLDDVGAVELEPEERSGPEARPALPRGIVSGVFAAEISAPPPVPAEARQVSLGGPPDPLQEQRRAERARLVIEDLSLRFDNPYAASSLVPPPRKPMSPAKIVGIAAVIVAAASAGWLVMQGVSSRGVTTAARQPVEKRAAEPSAPAPQAARAVEAPAAASQSTSALVVPPASTADRLPARPVREPARSADLTPAATAVLAPPPPAAKLNKPVEQASVAAAAPEPTASPIPEPAASPIGAPPPAESPGAPTTAAAATAAPSPTDSTATAATAPVATEASAAAPADLPVTPTREQVVAGFDAIQSELVQCAAGKHGVAQISATIASSGRISYALVGGKFQGSAEGSCMVRVVRSARFPQFSQPTLKVSYPVSL